jgi:hypothetical protein
MSRTHDQPSRTIEASGERAEAGELSRASALDLHTYALAAGSDDEVPVPPINDLLNH